MRFMIMVLPNLNESSAPDPRAGAELSAPALAQYNRTLQSAGVLLALDGLYPPATGARISRAAGRVSVKNGPCGEAGEGLRRYWTIQVRSREEAIEWARRAPMSDDEVIDVRQIREVSEFPGDDPAE
jgi:hypothetical protein